MRVYLNESSAEHERRHDEVTYMAKAISVSYLIQEVAKMCTGEPLPSEQWVRFQFCPKNPRAKTASQYRSQFGVVCYIRHSSWVSCGGTVGLYGSNCPDILCALLGILAVPAA